MGFLNDHFPRLNEKAGIARRTMRQYWLSGSPRALAQMVRYPLARLRSGRPPFFIDIALTYRCQCRCVHCSAVSQADDGEEMSTAEVKTLMDEAASLGVMQVIFSGGEPMLRRDIVELVAHATRLGMLVRLNTNGLLLTPERARALKQAGLVLVGLSIDHPDPEVHDRLRGVPGLFENAMEGVRLLHRAGILVQFQVYVSRETAGEPIRRIIARARELNVFCVFIFFAIASGRWESAFDELLTPEEEADVQSLQDAGVVNVEFATPHTPCCGLARKLVYIGASGNVSICPFVPYHMGNVREEGFAAAWRRRSAVVDTQYLGRCPMNTREDREVLKNHAASVAARSK